jgi:cephalosporin-C deacetylase-like acetyl esterase/enterochelin esterase-like enzyme
MNRQRTGWRAEAGCTSMHRTLACLLVLPALASAPPRPAFTDSTHESRVLREARHFRLFLPRDYDAAKRSYPVIYYFHGHSDRYTLERYDQGKDTVPKIAEFVRTHPVIVVAVDGYVQRDYEGFYGGSPWDIRENGGDFDFGAYFQELVTHVDGHYRTLRTRRFRATSGLSMGGFMSLYLSARYPDLIGSASAFNPGPEFYIGEKDRRILWRPKDHVSNHTQTMVRLVRASGDYISQYHEETKAAYANAEDVDFEYRRDEYHRHWATSIGETFEFHERAFENERLDRAPAVWHHADAYPEFAVWGYEVKSSGPGAALAYLSEVTAGGLEVTTRRWAPDGPPALDRKISIRTAPLYKPSQEYVLMDYDLATGKRAKSAVRAEANGRIALETGATGHRFDFQGPGIEPSAPILLPPVAGDFPRVLPGEDVPLPVRIYNSRSEPLKDVRVRVLSDYPTVALLKQEVMIPQLEAGQVSDLSSQLQARFTAGDGYFEPTRLRVEIRYDGSRGVSKSLDLLVAPEVIPAPWEVAVLDGRTATFSVFHQKGNQGGGNAIERTVTEGKGNGNGILEPGEEATVWVRLHQGLDPFDKGNWYRAKVYARSPWISEVADIEEQKQREWTSAKERTSVLRLAATAPAGTRIPLLLDNESWSFRFTPDVRYGREPLYQAFQLHRHHLHRFELMVQQAGDRGDLDFLTDQTDFAHLKQMLPEYCRRKAFALLDARSREIAKWGAADVTARKLYVREHMLKGIGSLPERTPLNPRVTGTIDRPQYRIEKIVFESQPGFFVTANLYLPKSGQPPYPAVLYPLGHESGGKSNPTWQQMLGSLASRGYVALTWDTLGQGERIQLYDSDLKGSKVVQSTIEHTMLGTSALVVGDSLARYTIWDGIRALDYLLTRPEVDPRRVAVSGNSGGGTHTAYLAAFDDRLSVAAPSCYITSWRRLLETIGPQDAEQCLTGWLAAGLDHGDFIAAFAPKPYQILSAIRDFFSITGARETFEEAKRVYTLAGAPDRMAMTEADDGHGFSQPRRVAAYDWFDRWLQGASHPEPEAPIRMSTEEELYCTPTGQVATSLGGETVHSLNKQRAQQLHRGQVTTADVARVVAYEKSSGSLNVRPFGRIEGEGYRIERLTYESEPGIIVPALLYLPAASGRKPAVVYAAGAGKANARTDAEALAKAGLIVLSIDARGFGETRYGGDPDDRAWNRAFGDYYSAMTAIQIGRTLVGMRAADIIRGVDLVASREDVDRDKIRGLGVGAAAVAMLHAAALDSRIAKVGLDGMLVSYQSIVEQKIHSLVYEQVVPGVLKSYDLPALVDLIAPRSAWIVDAKDPLGQLVPLDEVKALYHASVVRRRAEDNPTTLYTFEQ